MDGDVPLVSPKQLKRMIKLHYKKGIPLFIFGTFGIGKSSIVRQVAQELAKEQNRKYVEWNKLNQEQKDEVLRNASKYFVLVDKRLSQFDASEIKGLPAFEQVNGEKRISWFIPKWFITKEDSAGIIFFDELNLAPPAVQASAYSIILDRCLDEYVLPEKWMVVGAGNRASDLANVFEMPMPLLNRFSVVELRPPTIGEWTEWASQNDIDPRIVTYLNYKAGGSSEVTPRELFDERFASRKSRQTATPRSWEFVSKLIRETNDLEEIRIIVGARCGEGIALDFIGWLKLQDKLPKPHEVLEDPRKFPSKPDEAWLLIGVIANIYQDSVKKNRKEKTIELARKIVRLAKTLEPEYMTVLCRICYEYEKSQGKDYLLTEIIKDKELSDALMKYAVISL